MNKSSRIVNFDNLYPPEKDPVVGLFSAGFVPLHPYKFKEVSQLVSVALPRKGSFSDNPNSLFEGDFDLAPENGTILFGDLLKVFLSIGSYPDLAKNQVFVLNSIETEIDKIIIVGRVIEILEESNA